ncbi:inorganic triphosphatase [Litoribrevibacter albus]|uniref:CYTH domain-containing protein n=1 Tax=Litoribrevibacter albus TaxID=1473156 RepID=A0AA37SCA8_9GAMM|nr:CYTH domain-containing protein [Litoribrevibacter albus]GLQ33652.1 hypothetical protein GCM10007876_41320 [Litoribrevibacter albus]
MSQELELKLELSEDAVAQFLNLSWFHSNPANVRQPDKTLENIYFDTPDLQLLKTKAALRIRRSGSQYLQTLKTKGKSVGGLHQRGEWEFKIADTDADGDGEVEPRLQPELFPSDVWPAELNVDQLMPVFETNFTRSGWLWTSSKGSRIEVVLDQGQVIVGEQTTQLSELELELLEGSPECVFDLAEALSKQVPMLVSDVTKAQRGFELFQPGVWQTSRITLEDAREPASRLEWAIQGVMNPSELNDPKCLASVLETLVDDGLLNEMDVRPWLLFGDVSTLNPLLRGQWLLRLARYAWRHSS